MKLSDSHKIPQEKWDFKIIDVLITGLSRVRVLPGPPRVPRPKRSGDFFRGGGTGLEQHVPSAAKAIKATVGL